MFSSFEIKDEFNKAIQKWKIKAVAGKLKEKHFVTVKLGKSLNKQNEYILSSQ